MFLLDKVKAGSVQQQFEGLEVVLLAVWWFSTSRELLHHKDAF